MGGTVSRFPKCMTQHIFCRCHQNFRAAVRSCPILVGQSAELAMLMLALAWLALWGESDRPGRGCQMKRRQIPGNCLDNMAFVRYYGLMAEYARVNTSALDAANYVLELAESEGMSLDPITLQKILYYCQCWSLHDGQRLFDDPVEAWKNGPVVRCVWKAYSGSSVIRKADSPRYFELAHDQMDLIQGVWEMLKKSHGFTLSRQTHKPDTAWSKARGEIPETAPSDRELALGDMAEDAAKVHRSIAGELSSIWDDVIRCER